MINSLKLAVVEPREDLAWELSTTVVGTRKSGALDGESQPGFAEDGVVFTKVALERTSIDGTNSSTCDSYITNTVNTTEPRNCNK